VYTLGNKDLLKTHPIALFCSVKCPGEIITKTYDLCLKWRKGKKAVISGFHSPMERECLRILLQGTQPVLVCPARGIWKRIPLELRRHLELERLVIISKFPENIRRMTAQTAFERNQFLGHLANRIFVSFAQESGKMEKLCRLWIEQKKRVFTLQSKYNENLLSMGAIVTPSLSLTL